MSMNISVAAINEIKARMPELELRQDEAMSRHCSFRIGGAAAILALPATAEAAARLCRLLREMGIDPIIIGNGTNLLVTDEKLDRVVLKIGEKMSEIKADGENSLTAASGVTLARLANTAWKLGLGGLEFAHGIPGSLGGAVCMNAGAYGGEMKDVVKSTTYLDGELNLRRASQEEHDFSYRHSSFSDSNRIVLSCELELVPGDRDAIQTRMQELAEKRKSSQPLDIPSAGSTFKRPKNGYAAELIERAGLKGYAVGGAQVSEKHAGFVVNRGGAAFDDVISVMEHVRDKVVRDFGVLLEPEVKIIRA